MFELPIIVVGLRFGDAAIDFVVCCWCIHASLNHLRQRTGGSRCQCFRLSCAAGPLDVLSFDKLVSWWWYWPFHKQAYAIVVRVQREFSDNPHGLQHA